MSEPHGFHLHRPKAPLPSASDFDPWDGHLDAIHAWKHFGGLSLNKAYRLFLENPLFYQEDFMFMGPLAFDCYFPVIDRYLREFRREDDDDDQDGCAWILGAAMVSQLETTTPRPIATGTAMEIADLAAFMTAQIDRFARDPQGQRRILGKWREACLLAEARRPGA
jgi:hypothetical protein